MMDRFCSPGLRHTFRARSLLAARLVFSHVEAIITLLRGQHMDVLTCMGRYLTAVQIGELMQRNPAGIRNRFLTPMVEEGKLRRKFPDDPNRPDQAYTMLTSTDTTDKDTP